VHRGRGSGPARPLTQEDPDEAWEGPARKAGLSVADMRAQVRLADELTEEILREESEADPAVWACPDGPHCRDRICMAEAARRLEAEKLRKRGGG
jgi:hypothetical protein